MRSSYGFYLEAPSYEKFRHNITGSVFAGRMDLHGLSFTGSPGPGDGFGDGVTVIAAKANETRGFFEIGGFRFDYQHRDGRFYFIDLLHGQDARAHFRRHTQTSEINRVKRITGKPFVPNGDDAVFCVGFGYTKT